MSWGRLDDGFHDHPKVDDLTLAAVGLWTLCLSYALRHRKTAAIPGFIPHARVRKLAGRQTTKLAEELVTPPPGKKFGLWEPVEGGWIIHDFTDYLPKGRDSTEASESGKKGADARWHKRGSGVAKSHTDSQAVSHEGATTEIANGMAPDGSRASAPASPSRPVPSRTTEDQDLGGNRNETLPAADATQHPPDETTPARAEDARCVAHRGVDDPGPCRGCQAARERAERTAERAAEQAQREHERRARSCARCDGVHVIDEQGRPTRRKCDHLQIRSSA